MHASAQTDTAKTKDEIIINGKHYKAVDDKKNDKIQNKKAAGIYLRLVRR